MRGASRQKQVGWRGSRPRLLQDRREREPGEPGRVGDRGTMGGTDPWLWRGLGGAQSRRCGSARTEAPEPLYVAGAGRGGAGRPRLGQRLPRTARCELLGYFLSSSGPSWAARKECVFCMAVGTGAVQEAGARVLSASGGFQVRALAPCALAPAPGRPGEHRSLLKLAAGGLDSRRSSFGDPRRCQLLPI